MARIGFIGLGNMGLPMAQNLIKAGHQVEGVDVNPASLEKLKGRRRRQRRNGQDRGGARRRGHHHAAVRQAGARGLSRRRRHHRERQSRHAADRLLHHRCGNRARGCRSRGGRKGLLMLDAPVSGGVGGATAGTLTFMVGGSAQAFTRAESILQKMGKTIVHAGGAGTGQAAKICNNMILGVSMIAVSEAFVLAEKLGLDHQKLFDISSKSSGQCWSMTNYCPVPGPVPASPANRDYQAGFTAAMMLKDLKLSQDAAKASGRQDTIGRGRRKDLFGICRERGGGAGFFRHFPFHSRLAKQGRVNEALRAFLQLLLQRNIHRCK